MRGEHYHNFIYNQAEFVENIGMRYQDDHTRPYWRVVRFCPDCRYVETIELNEITGLITK